MSQIEHLKQTLYRMLESGDIEAALKISRELDALIVLYMKDAVPLKA